MTDHGEELQLSPLGNVPRMLVASLPSAEELVDMVRFAQLRVQSMMSRAVSDKSLYGMMDIELLYQPLDTETLGLAFRTRRGGAQSLGNLHVSVEYG